MLMLENVQSMSNIERLRLILLLKQNPVLRILPSYENRILENGIKVLKEIDRLGETDESGNKILKKSRILLEKYNVIDYFSLEKLNSLETLNELISMFNSWEASIQTQNKRKIK